MSNSHVMDEVWEYAGGDRKPVDMEEVRCCNMAFDSDVWMHWLEDNNIMNSGIDDTDNNITKNNITNKTNNIVKNYVNNADMVYNKGNMKSRGVCNVSTRRSQRFLQTTRAKLLLRSLLAKY